MTRTKWDKIDRKVMNKRKFKEWIRQIALIVDENTTKQSTKKRVIAIASRKSERLAKK